MTIDAVLSKLESLHAASTGGEWSKTSSLPTYAVASGKIDVVTATGREYRQNYSGKHGCRESDAEFIAAAHNLLPQVLAEIRSLQALTVPGAICGEISKLVNENATLKAEISGLRDGNRELIAAGMRIQKENIALRAEVNRLRQELENVLRVEVGSANLANWWRMGDK